MSVHALYHHSLASPWSAPEDEERRFRKILRRALLALLLLSLILPFLPLPEIEQEEPELPPRLAKLMMERSPPPPPPVKAAEPEPKLPEPKPAQPKKAAPEQPPPKPVETARARASRAGLLALKDDLADLRSNTVTSKLERDVAVTAPAAGTARSAERALITSSKAASGSGGIQTARMSSNTGGSGLAGRSTTQVDSPVGSGARGGGAVQRGSGGKASRSVDDVRLAIDRNKGGIYALYHRALRQDPSLQGKVVLKFTIAPSGQVVDLQIVSSELRAPELERKLLARIRQIDFGARDVETLIVNFPIDFLPS